MEQVVCMDTLDNDRRANPLVIWMYVGKRNKERPRKSWPDNLYRPRGAWGMLWEDAAAWDPGDEQILVN